MSQSSPPIRIASLGMGWVTTHRHLPTILANPSFKLVGLIDRDEKRLQSALKNNQSLKRACVSKLQDVPWINEIDAITLGSSPFSHYALIKEALQLGKHVLTEKPFTMTVPEGEELVALAEDKKLILGIVHNFQFSNGARVLDRDLASGRLGKLTSVIAIQYSNPRRRLPKWYQDLPLGLFYDESPHLLYLLRKYAPSIPELQSVDVVPSTMGNATPACVTARYRAFRSDGVEIPLLLVLMFETPVSEWHLTLHGEECLADLDVFRDIYIRLPNDGLHVTSTVVRTSMLASLQHWGQHFTSGVSHLLGTLRYGNQEVFGRFAKAVKDGVPPTGISAQDALAVLKMQHEIVAGAKGRGLLADNDQ
jgi:scyllo-inositol 2-dehydrogenase (NADP+)